MQVLKKKLLRNSKSCLCKRAFYCPFGSIKSKLSEILLTGGKHEFGVQTNISEFKETNFSFKKGISGSSFFKIVIKQCGWNISASLPAFFSASGPVQTASFSPAAQR